MCRPPMAILGADMADSGKFGPDLTNLSNVWDTYLMKGLMLGPSLRLGASISTEFTKLDFP